MKYIDIPFYDVFLSYSSKDRKWVKKLALLLKNTGFDVFFDEWVISEGQSITKAIESAIEKSRKILFIMTPNSVESAWVEFETKYDWNEIYLSNKGKLIPLLLKKCEIPKRIANIKFVNFTKGKFNQNYDALKRILINTESLEIQQYPLEKDAGFRKSFIEFVSRKAQLYFDYSDERINISTLLFNELTENAFIHPHADKNIVKVSYQINNHMIELKVCDSGRGFDLIKHIETTKSLLKKSPLLVKNRGLYMAFYLSDLMKNEVNDKGHQITAQLFKGKALIKTAKDFDELFVLPNCLYTKFSAESEKLIIIRSNVKSITTYNAEAFQHVFWYHILDYDPQKLIIDLTQTNFMDSTGIGVLVSAFKKFCKKRSDESYNFMVVLASESTLTNIFYVSSLHKVFTLFYSLDDALKFVKKEYAELS